MADSWSSEENAKKGPPFLEVEYNYFPVYKCQNDEFKADEDNSAQCLKLGLST